jgi:hypothetical protein
MRDWFQQNRSLVLSTAYLLVTLGLAGYVVSYSNLAAATRDLRAASKTIQVELAAQRAVVLGSNVAGVKTKNIDSIPEFLRHINSIAQANSVIIRSLTPDPVAPFKYHIEIAVNYETFLRFLANLESRDTIIHEMEVRPYDSRAIPPRHFITFSITPRNNAQPLADQRLKQVLLDVEKKNKRNPFQQLDVRTKHVPVVELTWVHRLTGIGSSGNVKYATIDRKDYVVGDSLKIGDGSDGENRKAVITAIDKLAVNLEERTANGAQQYVLEFRRKKKGS